MPNRPLHKLNIHKPTQVGDLNKMINLGLLLASFGTSKLLALLEEILRMVVSRSDNEIDDEAVDLIFAILSGKAEDIVKEARELAAEVAEEIVEEVTDKEV